MSKNNKENAHFYNGDIVQVKKRVLSCHLSWRNSEPTLNSDAINSSQRMMMNCLREHKCPKAGHKKENFQTCEPRRCSHTCVSHWTLAWDRRRRTGLHFPGCLWKSRLYNSLLPSRQIKGPLLKKKLGKRWRERVMGQHVGAFIAEQRLRAVNIISVRVHNQDYSLFVVVRGWAWIHSCSQTSIVQKHCSLLIL